MFEMNGCSCAVDRPDVRPEKILNSTSLGTAAVPTDVLFKIFSGLTSGLSNEQLQPFISNMHLALWVLAGISLLGAGISLLRPKHVHVDVDDVLLQEAA